ncbi:MAG: response regulator [Pseudomonadota bacterium]
MTETTRPLTLLLVEDDEVDVLSVRRVIRKLNAPVELRVAEDGIVALQLLKGSSGHEQVRRPFVVLLDLNMPRMKGAEFLAELRADPALRATVVFVMSTSDAIEDRRRAYQFDVAGYLVKSREADRHAAVLAALLEYCDAIEIPGRDTRTSDDQLARA